MTSGLAHPLRPKPANLPNPKIRNVIAIASGKGGVGKTWFAITLAQTLGLARQKILLFDADLGLANAHIQLGIIPQHDLGTVITKNEPLSYAINPISHTGFDLIAGRSGASILANLPTNRLVAMRTDLMQIAKNYDWLLIDLGAGVERSVRMMAAQAGITFLVTNDEPTSLTDAYAYIKVAMVADAQADIRLVVNAAYSAKDGFATYQTLHKACMNFLKKELTLGGVIRQDRRVPDSIRAQEPLLCRYPNTKVAHDVKVIANRLLSP